LNLTDIEELRHQLDAIATDVVNYQCEVSLQVPRTQDYPWLATLLTKRVKRIDSGYDLKIQRQILKNISAQVVLTPRKAE
ncbi:lipoprotein, partial [Rhodobacteraceae bacterium PD-2]